jgi:prohibitin 2
MSRYFTPSTTHSGRSEINMPVFLRDAAIALALLILLVTCWPVHTVPTGHRGVVTQGGAIKGIEPEGWVVLPPWQRLDNFNIRAEQADIEKADGATSDTQPVTVSMTVRYSVAPDKVAEVFEKYSKTGDLTSYMQTATSDALKAVTARYTATDLIAKRTQVANDIKGTLQAKVVPYGAVVLAVDMRNFEFGKSYMDAINDKVTQEQKRLAAENKLRTVEAEQKQKVAVAEAEANATKATADGSAYATLKNAQAQAEALRITNAALAQNKDVLELERIKVEQTKAHRWNGALPQNMYSGAPIPFLNMNK